MILGIQKIRSSDEQISHTKRQSMVLEDKYIRLCCFKKFAILLIVGIELNSHLYFNFNMMRGANGSVD